GRLSFAYFSLAKQRKVGALPGAHPGLQRHQKHYAFNSCLRPSRLGKAPISFNKLGGHRKCSQAHIQARDASLGQGGVKSEEPVAPRFDKPALNLQRKPRPDRQVLSR
ncbi:hypothetical protein, partial [Ottowia sp.]|uniref:hypothetical protein n=1 Tax=Ottowia sp. TaxID=1898956 RepID=UPI00261BE4AB